MNDFRLALLALITATAACSSAAEGPQPATAAPTPAATVAAPAPESAQEPTEGYVGVVLPSVAIDLAPTYDGKIDKVTVTVGQRVSAGDSVAEFDPAAAKEALEIARAQVRVAKGRAGEAAAAAKHASQRLATERSLFDQGITAADTVSTARADRAQAGAATASAAGEIAAAKARVEQLERQLTETALAAPFDGTVAAVYRESGSLAGPAKPVLRLIGTDNNFVRFAVPAEEAAALVVGRGVDVRLDWSNDPHVATVRDIAPEVDAPTGMVFVEAELHANAGERLVPNSAVWVKPRAS